MRTAYHSGESSWSTIVARHSGPRQEKMLLENGGAYFDPTQNGGMPHKGTDFTGHFVRLFLHQCTQLNCPVSIIFVDLVSAFHSVVKELATGLDTTDEHIAWLLQSLGIPPSATEEFAKLLQGPTVLQQTGIRDDFRSVIIEHQENSWFAVNGHNKIAATHRGTKPGDPFGKSSSISCSRSSYAGLEEI